MTFTQMKYFYTVCKYENYTKAAEELFISQPAISQAMKDLEAECGVTLFQRHGNTLTLTESGYTLRDEVKIILSQYDHLNHIVHDLNLKRNYIRVGLSSFSGSHVFPTLRCRFHLDHPEIDVISSEDVTSVLFEWLDSDKVDLIITSPKPEHLSRPERKNYMLYPIETTGLQFCVHKDHPLAERRYVTVSDIADEALVMLSDYYSPTKRVKQAFSKYGLQPKVIHYTSQMFSVERFIEQGAAAGFLPADVAEHNPTIVGIEFEDFDSKHQQVALVWKKQGLQHNSLKEFIATAKRMFPQNQ